MAQNQSSIRRALTHIKYGFAEYTDRGKERKANLTSITNTTCKQIIIKSNINENKLFMYFDTFNQRKIRPTCLSNSTSFYLIASFTHWKQKPKYHHINSKVVPVILDLVVLVILVLVVLVILVWVVLVVLVWVVLVILYAFFFTVNSNLKH